ncbi:unnamed protein product [Paramecium pentaurelia]|uniref:Transmembrane protein n=1 Tax=Paramecium pentaurelia TaxID=43138 RepID=A0A8S1V0Y6_9CILI|nr:unnamed protein product [Paramecium pentaurelia]
MSGISSTLFQAIVSQQIRVWGSFHIGTIGYALYLQQQIFCKYKILQTTKDYCIICYVYYKFKFHGILMIGSLLFGVQCKILGQYFSYEQKKQQQLQLTKSTKQTQLAKYIYLCASIIIISIELIVFFLLKNLIKI